MPRKPKSTDPAFVVEHAAKTDFTGLTKNDWFAGFVLLGIFAGPAGQAILESHDDAVLENAADVARHMGEIMVARGAA